MNMHARVMREASLIAYNYEVHEALAARLWQEMKDTGDLRRVFERDWTLTDFLYFFKMEVALVFLDDQKGIWFAAWIRQTKAQVAELAVWVRKDRRGCKGALLAWETVCGQTLKLYSTILGLSKPNLISIHKGLGYRHLGPLCDGIEIFTLTAETFKPRLYREI